MRKVLLGALALLPLLASGQEAMGPRGNLREFLGLGPAPDVAAAKRGEPLYKENCAACHGEKARGSQGPNLLRSPLVLHDEKGEGIAPVVKMGRPQGGMPAFANLSDSQIFEISQFIHLQIELAANRGTYRQTYDGVRNQVTGDAVKGKAFFDARCSGCHSVTGDLARVGSKYAQPPVMLSHVAWPAVSKPAEVTVTTAAGEKIKGTLLLFNDFDVSLRDNNGDYHNWPRTAVTVDIPDPLAGHRALLPKYTDADLHDVTAYLVTLK